MGGCISSNSAGGAYGEPGAGGHAHQQQAGQSHGQSSAGPLPQKTASSGEGVTCVASPGPGSSHAKSPSAAGPQQAQSASSNGTAARSPSGNHQQHHFRPEVVAAVTGRVPNAAGSGAAAAAAAAHSMSGRRTSASDVGPIPNSSPSESLILGTPRNSGHRLSPSALIARANSRAGTHKKNSIGADLHSIMDDQGMLNPLVARQMSVMSHYSVRSESGSVLITPEQKSGQAEFKLLKLIGRGGFGNVYLGEWEEGEKVAVKIIQGYHNSDQADEQEWQARKERMAQMEAVLMSAIAHDNIVRTLKVIAHQGDQVDLELAAVEKHLLKGHLAPNSKEEKDEGPPSFEWHILMEYCDKGSLSRALSTFMLHTPHDANSVKWDAWASLEILKEVVSSLIFLHEHRILHGDLKAANVLLTSSSLDRRKYIAKVSDFGLSRVLQNNKNHIKTQTFGTVTHVPPELLAKGTLSPKADIYAVGVLMWEIYTGEKVFKQLSDSEVILAVVTKKARPQFPSDVPSRYKFLAERCWSEMMELRPSLQVVMTELGNLQKNLCPEGPASPSLTCKVFPTRQKALAEALARQKSHAQAAAAREAQQAAAAAAAQQNGAAAPGGGPLGAYSSGSNAVSSTNAIGGGRQASVGPSSMSMMRPGSPSRAPPAPGSPSRAVAAMGAAAAAAAASTSYGAHAHKSTVAINGQVEPSHGSFNTTSQPAIRTAQRMNSSTGGAMPSPAGAGHGMSHLGPGAASPTMGGGGGGGGVVTLHTHSPKLRSSAGRNLSPLAPLHAGSPERVNQDLSLQRPAEPRPSSRAGSASFAGIATPFSDPSTPSTAASSPAPFTPVPASGSTAQRIQVQPSSSAEPQYFQTGAARRSSGAYATASPTKAQSSSPGTSSTPRGLEASPSSRPGTPKVESRPNSAARGNSSRPGTPPTGAAPQPPGLVRSPSKTVKFAVA